MALDWSNERYVRLYTRITPDMALWCWQAKAIWPWMLASAERSGTIAAKRGGAAGLAKLIGMPLAVVEAGLNGSDEDGIGLLDDGCVVATASGYSIPNYANAQTAQASQNKRAADYRARQRLAESLADCNGTDSVVTENHAPSRAVTENHAASREITPSRSEQSGAEKRESVPATPGPLVLLPTGPKSDTVEVAAVALLAVINTRGGYPRGYRPVADVLKDTRANLRKHPLDDQLMAVNFKFDEWLGNDRMRDQLKPSVLLRPSNMSRYVEEAKAGRPTPRNGASLAQEYIP